MTGAIIDEKHLLGRESECAQSRGKMPHSGFATPISSTN